MKNKPSVYVRNQGKNPDEKTIHESFVILAVYVDDITIAAASETSLAWAKQTIADMFQIKDKGKAKKIIGLEISKQPNGILIHQKDYLNVILKQFGMMNLNGVLTPMEPGIKLLPTAMNELIAMNAQHRHKIGALLFAATCTQPDICVAVNVCSRFVENPTDRHVSAVTKIFRYLKKMTDMGLLYEKGKQASTLGHIL